MIYILSNLLPQYRINIFNLFNTQELQWKGEEIPQSSFAWSF